MHSTSSGRKRTVKQSHTHQEKLDLFVPAAPDNSDSAGDNDSTDSEESVYSGLEEEGDSEEASSVESFEEGTDSNEEEATDSEDSSVVDDSDEESEDQSETKENRLLVVKDTKKTVSAVKSVQRLKKSTVDTAKTQTNISKKSDKNISNKDIKLKTKIKKKNIEIKSQQNESKKPANTASGSDDTAKPGSGVNDGSEVNVNLPDEYQYDSSDEEDLRNTVGNIPMEWYREYDHIGYDLQGSKIIKPKSGDELDEFLNKMDNPDYWRTVKDKTTGQDVVLTKQDAELIKRFRRGKYVDPSQDPYQPWIDFFTHEKMIHPLTNHPAQKRSFIPSKWEKLKVGQMVHSMRMGWMKPPSEKKPQEEEDEPNYYMLWRTDDQPELNKRFNQHIPAPKLTLPGHAESYNPPPEYLLSEEEELAWREQDPEERRLKFLPKTFSSLRQVPGYDRFINERFERCLDLYLCPRQRKMRMNVDPEDLIPKLPKPRDLQPFPTTQAIVYRGHDNIVRCISTAPSGQWIVSGSDDQTLRLWEVSTGRCIRTLPVSGVVKDVAWNPSDAVSLVAAAIDNTVVIVNPLLADCVVRSNTDNLISSCTQPEDGASGSQVQIQWEQYEGKDYDDGFRLKVTHPKAVTQISWHGRGDYLSSTMPQGEGMSVVIHQVSRRRSQLPLKKSKGLVQCVLFHPVRPFLFVATQRYVRVYNLLKQELTKKLMTNVKWVSSMSVHHGGDNIIIGSYDSRLSWFDLDLSSKPYQTLRHHKKAIRQVCYHKKYPLFASASDDGTVIVCHGMVYNDLLQNPLIVPVKILRGHEVKKDLGVLDCEFHPTQPWIFSSGVDNTIRLYT